MGGLCQKCEQLVGADRCDYELANLTWKEAFGAPRKYLQACCKCDSKAYFFWRVALFVLWLLVIMESTVLDPGFTWKWFIYMTHWGGLLLLIYLALAAFSTWMAIWGSVPDGKREQTPWFIRLTWFLGTMVPVAESLVAILFWAFVYEGGKVSWLTLAQHGGNLVLALVDVAISRQPYYVAHVWTPLLFSVIYVAFSYVYFLAGGTDPDGNPYIYKVLDWANPEKTGSLVAAIVLVAVPVVYAGIFLLALAFKCCGLIKAPPIGYDPA